MLGAIPHSTAQLTAPSRRRVFSAIGWTLVISIVPVTFMGTPGPWPAICLYGYSGLLLLVAAGFIWQRRAPNTGLIRTQWAFLSISLALQGITYLTASGEALHWYSTITSVSTMNLFSSCSMAILLLSLTACGGGTTRAMRLLDVAMVEILCWIYYLAIHSNDATGFSRYHLIVSTLTFLFMVFAAVCSYKGTVSNDEASYIATAFGYLAARTASAFLINIVAFHWLKVEGETLFNLLFGVPALTAIVLAVYQRERVRSEVFSTARRTPNLATRSLIPSLVALAGVLLSLAIAHAHSVASGAAIAIIVGCYVVRVQLLQRQMMARHSTLVSRAEVLEEMANRDVLTNAANRRGLEEAIHRVNAGYAGKSAALLLVDLDHFKQINDTCGHRAGDAVLAAVAAILDRSAATVKRSTVARIGGDEFVVLLPNTSHDSAMFIAERIRREVELLHLEEVPTGISISMGVSVRLAGKLLLLELLHDADQALYRAKSRGRNLAESSAMNTTMHQPPDSRSLA